MKRFKGIYVALIVSMIIMGAISACGGGGGGGNTPVATGEVTGKILDSMGDPIVGAEVTINSTPVTVFTDIAGAFWAEVEVGSHTITISMGTYTIYQGIFTLFGESGIYLGDLDPTNPYYSNGMTWYKDSDGDLYSSGDSEFADAPSNGYVLAGGLIAITGDCDDTNSAVNPGATEVCNGIDDNCAGGIDEGVTTTYYADTDTDNYGNPLVTQEACVQPAGYVTDNTDCNDLSAAINPGATEICNGADDNCAGGIDEGVTITFYADTDIDSYGNPLATTQACTAPAGYVADNTDCDDTSAAVNPGATEVCNSVDDNCVGGIDEGVTITFYADTDIDSYGDPLATTQACTAPAGYVADNTDCDDTSAAVNPGAAEVCNSIDDNCDGGIDEGLALTTFYYDSDSDAYGDSTSSTAACSQPAGYVTDNTDCDDTSAAVNPGAAEVCNDIDDNCDGGIDEGLVLTTFYYDSDSDAYGDSTLSTDACAQPAGYVTDNTDCNDFSAAVNPGATEVCNGIDDNCDGLADDDAGSGVTDAATWYHDEDGDSYTESGDTLSACIDPDGATTLNWLDAESPLDDCDDTNAAVNPGATEVCNGIDDNCVGGIDEGVGTTTYYADSDSDTYGNPAVSTTACAQPAGYVTDNTDCDDTSAAVNPSQTEVCNSVDDNCNGGVDEGLSFDTDSDGYSSPASCAGSKDDCNDFSAAVNPGATEVCNGIDDNCVGGIDEGVSTMYYADADVDTYGDPLVSQAVCSSPPAGYVTDDNDCDDSNAAINPAATEVYNDVDDDCDGEVDDGIIWYLDADGDGYSSGDTTTYPPGSDDYQRFELLATVGDCNDSDDTVHPGNKNCYGNAVGGEVLIGAGGECFEMGDSLQEGWSDETEVHTVCFTSDFYMDKYEVTNAEYEACVDAGDCTAPASNVSDTRRSSPWYYGNSYYDNFPVIYVNWNQAAQYCSAQGKRLPTEAEWEYAARGGLSGKRYPWGDTLDSGNYANYYTSWDPWQDAWVPEDTAPGGFYAYNGSEPNGYGLYDMAGNVHEWVADWYSGGFYYGLPDPVFDPINTTVGTYKVERGGAYLSPRNYTEVFDPVIDSVRVSMRHEYDPASGEVTIGIRCVRDP